MSSDPGAGARARDAGQQLLVGQDAFAARLVEFGRHAPAGGARLAVLCLDLDRFRQIEAAFGYQLGEAVLRAVGLRLRTGLRDPVALAHLAGDKFAVAVPVADAEGALASARALADLLRTPLRLADGPTVRVSASIGASIYPDHGADAQLLLHRADVAVRLAKDRSEANCQLYDPAMETAPQARHALLMALHESIGANQFSIAFQPKLALADGRYAGAEVLVRWLSPTLGEVPPDRFVPVAEEAGLIEGLGEWVLAQTAGTIAAWHDAGIDPGCLAVNVSAAQLRDPAFAQRFAELVRPLDGRGPMLEVEVTESALLANVATARQRLGELRELGALITLDDFGTGYSAFSHLKHLPIDALKIAAEFVADVDRDADAARLASAMIALGRKLGLRVVAEGIETQAQADFLAAQGCDEGQGWLFARPMSADDLPVWLAGRSRGPR